MTPLPGRAADHLAQIPECSHHPLPAMGSPQPSRLSFQSAKVLRQKLWRPSWVQLPIRGHKNPPSTPCNATLHHSAALARHNQGWGLLFCRSSHTYSPDGPHAEWPWAKKPSRASKPLPREASARSCIDDQRGNAADMAFLGMYKCLSSNCRWGPLVDGSSQARVKIGIPSTDFYSKSLQMQNVARIMSLDVSSCWLYCRLIQRWGSIRSLSLLWRAETLGMEHFLQSALNFACL